MKQIDEVLTRMKSLYGAKTRIELCEKMGIGLSTYDTWRNKNRIPDKKIRQIAEDCEVRYEWLLSGEGDKFLWNKPMFLSRELQEAIKNNIKKESPCEENATLQEICRAFSRISEEKQEDALKQVLSIITRYY